MKKVFGILLCLVAAVAMFGCGASFDADRNIVLVARDSASGTREAFEKGVGLGADEMRKGAEELASTGAVIEKVANDAQAVGYVSAGLVNRDKVKATKLAGVEPTSENILNKSYALQRPFNVVYKPETLENAVFADFEKYLRSSNVGKIIEEDGAVKLSGSVNGMTYGEAYVKPSQNLPATTINVTGSTSIGPAMEVIAEEYHKLNPNVTVKVTQNGSSAGIEAVNKNTAEFGMASKDVAVSETMGVTQIAIDGVAIIVNKSNPIEDLTLAQIRSIYSKGVEGVTAFVKWSEVK